jgi:hypothetical protein
MLHDVQISERKVKYRYYKCENTAQCPAPIIIFCISCVLPSERSRRLCTAAMARVNQADERGHPE